MTGRTVPCACTTSGWKCSRKSRAGSSALASCMALRAFGWVEAYAKGRTISYGGSGRSGSNNVEVTTATSMPRPASARARQSV